MAQHADFIGLVHIENIHKSMVAPTDNVFLIFCKFAIPDSAPLGMRWGKGERAKGVNAFELV